MTKMGDPNMTNREQAHAEKAARSIHPHVVNPQVALAPGEDALEAAADKAGPTASVQRHAEIVNGIIELADKEEYVDEP
jgi:hypothetical protein